MYKCVNSVNYSKRHSYPITIAVHRSSKTLKKCKICKIACDSFVTVQKDSDDELKKYSICESEECINKLQKRYKRSSIIVEE